MPERKTQNRKLMFEKENHIGTSRYKIAFQIKIFSNFQSKGSTFNRNVQGDAYRITDEYKMGQ